MNTSNLRNAMSEKFNLEEIKMLFADLNLDYDNFQGDSKPSKIQALIQYLNRVDRSNELLVWCKKTRETVDWNALSSDFPEPKENSSPSSKRGSAFPGYPRKDVEDFLNHSDLALVSIDGAILTYDCPQQYIDWGWDASDISFEHVDALVDRELNPELQRVARSFQTSHPSWRNSIKYCVDRMDCPMSEGRKLRIQARSISYLTAYPVAEKLQTESLSSSSFRHAYFSRLNDRSRPLSPNMLIAHVLVVTGDNKLVLQRRAGTVGYHPHTWSASFEEHYNAPWGGHLKQENLYEESVDTSIFGGIERGLREELRLSDASVHQSTIKVLGVGIEYHNFVANVYAMVELPKYLDFARLRMNLGSTQEHDRFSSCNFEARNLINCVTSGSQPSDMTDKPSADNWQWHPTSRMRLYLALMRRLGPSEFLSMLHNH